jgi:hypothetical protein
MCVRFRDSSPFYEGGSGIRNNEHHRLEMKSSKAFLKKHWIELGRLKNDLSILHQINVLERKKDLHSIILEDYDKLSFFLAAKKSGLLKLLNGGVFRDTMPDSNYSSKKRIKYSKNIYTNSLSISTKT